MTAARDLADRFHQRWLAENPFSASMYGIPGYDDLMPDESEEGERAWRAEVEGFLTEADAIDPDALTPADVVTLDCTREMATQELTMIDMAQAEHTVTAMQYAGPAVLMAVAARTVLLDAAAAEAYLTRLRRSARGSTRPASGCGPEPARGGSRSPRSSCWALPGPRPCWPVPCPDRCCPPSRRRGGRERRRGRRNAAGSRPRS